MDNHQAFQFGEVELTFRNPPQIRAKPSICRGGPAVLTVYGRYQAGLLPNPQLAPARSALAEVRAYVDGHRSQLHDLTGGHYPA